MADTSSPELVVRISADLSGLQADLAKIGPIVQQATSKLSAITPAAGASSAASVLKSVGQAANEAMAPMKALQGSLKEASADLSAIGVAAGEGAFAPLTESAKAANDAMADVGKEAKDAAKIEPPERLYEFFQLTSESADEATPAVEEANAEIEQTGPTAHEAAEGLGQLSLGFEQVPVATGKAGDGFRGLLRWMREHRTEQVQQSRMSRFFANELLSLVPGADGAKRGLAGLIGVFVQGASGGIGFGLALEAVKLGVGYISEAMSRNKKEAQEWADRVAQSQAQIKWAAIDLQLSFGPPLTKTENLMRDKAKEMRKEAEELRRAFQKELDASTWSKMWDGVLGNGIEVKLERLVGRLRSLENQEVGLWVNPEIQKAAFAETLDAAGEYARQSVTLEAGRGSDLERARRATQDKLDEFDRNLPTKYREAIQRMKAAHVDLGKAHGIPDVDRAAFDAAMKQRRQIELGGQDETARIKSSRDLAFEQARINHARTTANAEKLIDLDLANTKAGLQLQIADAERRSDGELKRRLENQQRWAEEDAEEKKRQLKVQQDLQFKQVELSRLAAYAVTEGQKIEIAGMQEIATLEADLEANKNKYNAAERTRVEQRIAWSKEETANKLRAWEAEQALLAERAEAEKGGQTEDAIVRRAALAQQASALIKAGYDEETASLLASTEAMEESGVRAFGAIAAQARDLKDATEAAFGEGAISPEQYLANMARVEAMMGQSQEGIARVQEDAAARRWAAEHKYAAGFINNLQSTWASGLARVFEGTLSFRDALSGIWGTIRSAFAQMASSMLMDWVKTQAMKLIVSKGTAVKEVAIEVWATTTKVALSVWGAIKSIAVKAYEAAAGAYAAIAQIPLVGPFLAPAISAAVLAAVIGLGARIAHAAGGYDIPRGVNPLVQAHSEEMILPAKYANPLRKMLEGGGEEGGGGSGMPPVTVHLSGVDGPSIMRMMRSNEGKSALATAITEALRDGRMRS